MTASISLTSWPQEHLLRQFTSCRPGDNIDQERFRGFPCRPSMALSALRGMRTVSQINGCAYCIDMHSRDLIKEGLAVEKLVVETANIDWRGRA